MNHFSSIALVAIISLAAISGCTDESPTTEGAVAVVQPAPVLSAEDIVRLPDGRVVLCEEATLSMHECKYREYLDPDWSVERVLSVYPFFDPEEAAGNIWMSAEKRFMSDRISDPNTAAMWWTPRWLPDLLAVRDDALATFAQDWGRDWTRYATQSGYRDLIGWRREIFEGIQSAAGEGELNRIPSCEEQTRVLQHVALCDAAEYVSTEWTVNRIASEFDRLDVSDTMLILELIRSDAQDQRDWMRDPQTYGGWTEDRLPERLASWSAERFFARKRLRAQAGFEFLEGQVPASRAEFGPLVKRMPR